MYKLTCGQIEIPLAFIDSISWAKTAKIITHIGGYISARGHEGAEISVRAVIDPSRCAIHGLDYADQLDMMDKIKTDKTSISGVFRIAGYAIYPELEFALTNINKTVACDLTGAMIGVEADMVFSGVKAVKEVNRNRALELDGWAEMPGIVLIVDGKELEVKDSMQITQMVSQPDAITLSVNIGSDMDLVSRSGFLEKILNSGSLRVAFPQGDTTFYIIDADLVDEALTITGSVYPPKAAQIYTKTYHDTTLKEIILDLAEQAGIECECLIDGSIEYYMVNDAPVNCLKSLAKTAGFIMSYRQGKLTCVDVPERIIGLKNIEYIELEQDSNRELLKGIYWTDGIRKRIVGDVSTTSELIKAPFRSSDEQWADNCFYLALYERNILSVLSDIDSKIDAHSAISVHSNDAIVNGMVEWFELDWINNSARYEIHYTGRE